MYIDLKVIRTERLMTAEELTAIREAEEKERREAYQKLISTNSNPDCIAVCRKAMESAGVRCPGWYPKRTKNADYEGHKEAIRVILRRGIPHAAERWPVGHDYECETHVTALCGIVSAYAGDRG